MRNLCVLPADRIKLPLVRTFDLTSVLEMQNVSKAYTEVNAETKARPIIAD